MDLVSSKAAHSKRQSDVDTNEAARLPEKAVGRLLTTVTVTTVLVALIQESYHDLIFRWFLFLFFVESIEN